MKIKVSLTAAFFLFFSKTCNGPKAQRQKPLWMEMEEIDEETAESPKGVKNIQFHLQSPLMVVRKGKPETDPEHRDLPQIC